MAEKEYIEREKLNDMLEDFCVNESFYDALQTIPSADVSPVRHGYWVKEKRDVLIHWHCSACKECYFLEEPNAEFCPHCGAKMDEEEREEKCLMPKD